MFSFQVVFHLRIQSSRTFSNFELQKGKPKHLHRKIHSQTIGLCKKVVLSRISLCSKILVERNYKVRKTFGNLLEHSSQFRFQYVPKKGWIYRNCFQTVMYFVKLFWFTCRRLVIRTKVWPSTCSSGSHLQKFLDILGKIALTAINFSVACDSNVWRANSDSRDQDW